MHFASMLSRQFPQVKQVQQVVAVASKAGGTIVATLDDVSSDPTDEQSQLPWHGKTTIAMACG
jgi:hypothetical protein